MTLVSVGVCTVEASQAGNASYATAAPVDQSFTVTQASQTITFAALSNKAFGSAPITISATASSGLPVSFASNSDICNTVSGTTVTPALGGVCNNSGEPARERHLWRGHGGGPELHGDAGDPDHHLRRYSEPASWGPAGGERDRFLRTASRSSMVATPASVCTSGIGHHRDNDRCGHLHHSGLAGRRQQLGRGTFGEPAFQRDAGDPDHHLQRAFEPGIGNRSVYRERDCVLGASSHFHFDYALRVHGIGGDGHFVEAGLLHDPGRAGRRQRLLRGEASEPDVHGDCGLRHREHRLGIECGFLWRVTTCIGCRHGRVWTRISRPSRGAGEFFLERLRRHWRGEQR